MKNNVLSPHSNHRELPGGGRAGGRGRCFGGDLMPCWRRNLTGKVKLVNSRTSVDKARVNLMSQSEDTKGGLGNYCETKLNNR